ncbi:MAG: hypothetical protein AABY14_00600 [Nanoarchaeota archaeon]
MFKSTLYQTIDNLVINIWPRVQDYRELGRIVIEDRKSKESERKDISKDAKTYLLQRENDLAFLTLGGLYQIREVVGIQERT